MVQEGILDAKSFEVLYGEAQRKKQNIVDVLVSQGVVSADYFYTLLAKSLGVMRANLAQAQIDLKTLKMLDQEAARQRRAIVFAKKPDGSFAVAMEDPTNLETIDFLSLRLGGPVRPYLASDDDLDRGFLLYEQEMVEDFQQMIEKSVRESLKAKTKENLQEAASELPVVELVNSLLSYAVSLRSSDVHFEVLEDSVLVRFRIDGILREMARVPKEIHPPIVARLKILSRLRVDEHSHPQDGRFRHKIMNTPIDVRTSVIPTFYGEKIVLRLLVAAQKPVSLSDLGMLDDHVALIENTIKRSYGMVLVCGPTGAGKTTTLYSILNILNRPEVNVVSVEDPIEYDMRYVNQVQVNPAAGITFASGLRSILRQDPDIIMVGEIRDSETANISIQAALTGHMVLSSLHTNDSPTAVPRLVDMGIPAFLVAAVLGVVSSQRLSRRIHKACIESYAPEQGILREVAAQVKLLGIDAKDVRVPRTFYRGRGCAECGGSGYLGRVGIFEVLHCSEAVRKLITDPNFSLDELRALARAEGMITMFEDGLRKVERGMITIEEVFRVIRD